MSRFTFRLDPARDFRKKQEDDHARVLGEARADLVEAERARTTLEEVREASWVRLRRTHASGGSAGHLRNLEHVLEALDRKIADAATACLLAEDHVASSLADFVASRKRREILDHLRERRMDEWRVDQRRREQAQIDEAALGRFGRKRAAGSGS